MRWLNSSEAVNRLRIIGGSPSETHDDPSKVAILPYEGGGRLLPLFLQRILSLAGISQVQVRKCALIGCIGTAMASGCLAAFGLVWPALVTPLAVLLLAYSLLVRAVYLRAERFERDLPVFLLSLAASVKTGMDPLLALFQTTDLFPRGSELRRELHRVRTQIEKGESEECALLRFGESIEHPDIRLFRTVFILSRRQGSSLAPSLHRLAKVTRHRQSFRRKSRAAIAMQKLSSLGIAGCALLIALIQIVTNPEALREAVSHPVGVKVLFGGVMLIVGGVAWMLRMTRGRI